MHLWKIFLKKQKLSNKTSVIARDQMILESKKIVSSVKKSKN
jgi:hypothetical protein